MKPPTDPSDNENRNSLVLSLLLSVIGTVAGFAGLVGLLKILPAITESSAVMLIVTGFILLALSLIVSKSARDKT